MTETPQQYTQRVLRHIEGQDAVKVQSTSPKRLARLIKGVPLTKLRKRPAPNHWSVVEILAHLADVELAVAWRLRLILGNPGVQVQAYDQDAWADAGNYQQRDPRQSIELYRAVRKANLALLKSLSRRQWKLSGHHAERGEESIERIVRLAAGHDINHIKQIESILRPVK